VPAGQGGVWSHAPGATSHGRRERRANGGGCGRRRTARGRGRRRCPGSRRPSQGQRPLSRGVRGALPQPRRLFSPRPSMARRGRL
jgi:hypothetical protein